MSNEKLKKDLKKKNKPIALTQLLHKVRIFLALSFYICRLFALFDYTFSKHKKEFHATNHHHTFLFNSFFSYSCRMQWIYTRDSNAYAQSPTYIEELTVAQNIICCDEDGKITTSTIKALKKFEADTLIILELDTTTTIRTTPEQLMYVPQKKAWVKAHELELGESLCFYDNSQGIITKKNRLPLHCSTYCISVENHHNFFFTDKHVLVHNFAVMIPICVWTFGEGLAWTSASAIATALTTALCTEAITNFAKKLGAKVSRSTCGTPPPPEDPNGPYSYRYGREGGANYHHQNSNGIKNPAPLDAQKALDNSVAVINRLGESRHRISLKESHLLRTCTQLKAYFIAI